MKIDSDLRIAIRAVIDSQKRVTEDYGAARERKKEAIADLIKRRKLGSKVRALRAKRIKITAATREIDAFFNALGISQSLDQIYHDDRFAKAGGKITVIPKPQRFEAVMAMLAQATPPEGAKIINGLGIKWEVAK